MSLGDIVRIDDRTVLVIGQELDIKADQPDVANALIHRVADTVFVVDTGVTAAFRTGLVAALDQVGSWREVIVLNTHGHVEQIRIGSQRLTGWTFADGAVQVLRSQGHCTGHVVVHLRDLGLLHLGDEANGPCGIMRDADQVKLTSTLASAVRMIEEGQVAQLTDGHTFGVQNAAEAQSRLETMLDQSLVVHNATLTTVGDQSSIDLAGLVDDFGRMVSDLGVGGPNRNPMFTGFMAGNVLRNLGLIQQGPARRWSRPRLQPVRSTRGPARATTLLLSGASMVSWKVRGKDRRRP